MTNQGEIVRRRLVLMSSRERHVHRVRCLIAQNGALNPNASAHPAARIDRHSRQHRLAAKVIRLRRRQYKPGGRNRSQAQPRSLSRVHLYQSR